MGERVSMDRKRREKLKKAGWKIGDTQEFLNLSDEEMAYIDLKILLAQALLAKRKSLKLSQETFAEILHSSQSRIAKMEAGDPTVSLDLLIKSLLTVGTTNRQLANVISAPLKKAA